MVWSAVSVSLNHLGKFLRIIFEVFQTDLVDIVSPPTGKLSFFNLYVALSWSSGQETICLLRDFDDQLFTQAHMDWDMTATAAATIVVGARQRRAEQRMN
jgi:hypothetical protein